MRGNPPRIHEARKRLDTPHYRYSPLSSGYPEPPFGPKGIRGQEPGRPTQTVKVSDSFRSEPAFAPSATEGNPRGPELAVIWNAASAYKEFGLTGWSIEKPPLARFFGESRA